MRPRRYARTDDCRAHVASQASRRRCRVGRGSGDTWRRPPVPDRLRRDAAGAADLPGPAGIRRARARRSRARAAGSRGVAGGGKGVDIIDWPETDDPVALVAKLVRRARRVAVDDHMWAERCCGSGPRCLTRNRSWPGRCFVSCECGNRWRRSKRCGPRLRPSTGSTPGWGVAASRADRARRGSRHRRRDHRRGAPAR